jgi:hypothetical protein
LVGDLVQLASAGMQRRRSARHRERAQADDREAFLLRIKRYLDRRDVLSRVRNDDDHLTRAHSVAAVVALNDARTVACDVLSNSGAGVEDAAHANQSAGSADQFARQNFGMAAAKSV